ncbi:MAG: type II toxin-antitoxin system VapB family antitoxin [Hyphomicrobiales bacterium]
MPLSIKNREVEELARELARISGKPITEAVRDSLKREVERAKVIASVQPKDADFVERILEIGRRCAALPDVSTLSDDEILGYDEHGAPTR